MERHCDGVKVSREPTFGGHLLTLETTTHSILVNALEKVSDTFIQSPAVGGVVEGTI